MKINRLGSLLLSVVLLVSASLTNAQECKTARVRRSWTALSADDRQLYKDAVAMAMDTGKYIRFVEIHTEMMGEHEAHQQCMFTYWHRAFLVAYENMLRDLHPRFACVTVPFWDWVTDHSNFSTGKCANMLECSPSLEFVGGRPPVAQGKRNVTINNVPVEGYCADTYPLNHFCQDSLSSGAQCVKCVPRGDWANASFPAVASYASVRSQIFGSKNIGEMSVAIEVGPHNNIHGELDGAMGFNQSPSDFIFWSHHAMVDLLHSIFHKCKVGEQRMTFQQKATSVDWTSCRRRNSTVDFQPTDEIVMRTGFNGTNVVNASEDPLVGKYFRAVPLQYAAVVDIRDLGESSYTYELDGLLGSMFTECAASAKQLPAQQKQSAMQVESVPEAPQSANAAKQPPTMASLLINTTSSASQAVQKFVNTTDAVVLSQGGNALLKAEKMACLYQDQCLGGVTTYSAEFKKRFGIEGEPRCKQIVDQIYADTDAHKTAEWMGWTVEMVKTFGCPRTQMKANPAKQSSV